MTHDPLCPHDSGAYHELGENSCRCDEYAKVRADALRKAVEAVREAPQHDSGVGFNGPAIYLCDAVVAICSVRGGS